MALHISVTTEILDQQTGIVDRALVDEILVEIDSVTEARVFTTEYPKDSPRNCTWQGNGIVLFTSLRSFWTLTWPIVPGDYYVKSTLREDTRFWQRKTIRIDVNGNVTVLKTEVGAP